MERHSFRVVSENMGKLCLSIKSPHHKIRRNHGILCSVMHFLAFIFDFRCVILTLRGPILYFASLSQIFKC